MRKRLRRVGASAFSVVALAAGCGGSNPEGVMPGTTGDSGAARDASEASTSNDASPSSDGGSGLEAGAPIVAPDDTWTWVDFPASKCASGAATGIGVSPHAGATELVIYLEGGGGCSDAESCWGPSPTANNLAGYDATTFAAATQRNYPLLDRTLASNPLAGASMVYVPYCTGDMHGGTQLAQLAAEGGAIPTYFWGARDLDLFLARLVPTFPGMKRVILFGTSAGGFGTVLDFDRVARAFGVRVDVIDDSGPAIAANGQTDNAGIFHAWNVEPPAGCTGCNSLAKVLAFDRAEQRSSRYAFLSFTEDDVIAPRFGYTLAEYPGVVGAFSSSLAGDANAATFLVSNETSHVVESDGTLTPQYMPWLTQMLADDSAWKDATYAK